MNDAKATMNSKLRNHRRRQSAARRIRRGVTVIEVLFATGIAIAGMLGIASLLLMAGRNASQANRSTQSQALAHLWYGELLTRGMNDPSSWVWFQDYGNSPGLTAFSKSLPTLPTGSLPAQAPNTFRPAGKLGVCIDPLFFSDRDVRQSLAAYRQSGSNLWYRPAVFPYYQDKYNPLTDSDFLVSTTAGLAWHDQPRLLRVTFGSPAVPMSAKQVQNLFGSQDELSMFASEEDRTLPAVRNYEFIPQADATLPPVIAKASKQMQFSWMATMTPLEEANESAEDLYTLSLVVIHQRDRLFLRPGDFVERDPLGEPTPDSKPQGERVTWVVPLSGNFTGGSGGRVRLIASAGTDDTVNVGDWIMLSRHVSGVRNNSNIEPFSIFRWYRIIGVDREATVDFIDNLSPYGTDLFGNDRSQLGEKMWAMDVVLDGPDWQFLMPKPNNGGGVDMLESYPVAGSNPGWLGAPTTGTLVKGAVAVYERVVEVPNSPAF